MRPLLSLVLILSACQTAETGPEASALSGQTKRRGEIHLQITVEGGTPQLQATGLFFQYTDLEQETAHALAVAATSEYTPFTPPPAQFLLPNECQTSAPASNVEQIYAGVGEPNLHLLDVGTLRVAAAGLSVVLEPRTGRMLCLA